MGMIFNSGGMLTTIQDKGRLYHQGRGLTPAGAMDLHSLRLGNILVGNNIDEAGLEITAIGPSVTFEEDNVIAITGADLSPRLNRIPLQMYRAVAVKKGDELDFGRRVNGFRCYMTVAGGLDVPEIMGSKSTLLRNHLGGYEGRAIAKGDRLELIYPVSELPHMEKRILPKEIFDTEELTLRILMGPHDYDFDRDTVHKFFWYGAVVNEANDRMGYRLTCEPLKHTSTGGNVLSDGIAFGSIQVPSDGKPIILMADRPTSGGYTKIGSVISTDLSKLAQVTTGCKLRFVQVSINLAQDLYVKEEKSIRNINAKINSEG